jgi:hypothetical protein
VSAILFEESSIVEKDVEFHEVELKLLLTGGVLQTKIRSFNRFNYVE